MQMKEPSKATNRLIIISVAFIMLVVAITLLIMPYMQKLLVPQYQAQFKEWVNSMGIAGWLAVLGIQVLQIVIAFIPGEPIEILSGILYGTLGGLSICLLGCVIASTFVFLISGTFGKQFINKMFNEEKVNRWSFMHESNIIEIVIFILFLIPGTPKDMLTYIVGVSNIKLSKFLFISTFARIPSIFSSTMLGSTMRQGEWKISIAVFVITAVIGLAGIVYKNRMIEYCRNLGKHKVTG